MKIDLMRDASSRFPSISTPKEVTRLRVWHCKYKSLDPITELTSLEELVIASFPDTSLDLLVGLEKLRYLRIMHMPKITDISPIAALRNLDTLSLSTSPSWDSKGKRTIVRSLAPLAELSELRHIELIGVVPEILEGSLATLKSLPHLETARLVGYAKNDTIDFFSNGTIKDCLNPKSSF